MPFEHANRVRASLRAITSDPAHGADALSDAGRLHSLLQDLMPDAPRETGLLVAAVQAGLPGLLRDHIARGMDPANAVSLAAATLEARTAFSAPACRWVAAELAIALGCPPADGDASDLPPGAVTGAAGPTSPPEHPVSTATTGARPRAWPAEDAPAEPPGARTSHPVPSPARRIRSLAIAGVAVTILAALAIGSVALAKGLGSQRHPAKVPGPQLARFVPASQRVTRVDTFRLWGAVPEVVVITTSQPGPGSLTPPRNLMLLAWDRYARRWSLMYDAAKDPVVATSDPDTSSPYAALSMAPQPLLPAGMGIVGIHVRAVHDQPHGGADLLIDADMQVSGGYDQTTAIIHDDGRTARVAWAFTSEAGTATVTGREPRQEVVIESEFATPADLEWMPLRGYRLALTPGRTFYGEYYHAVSDSRPWLGAVITEQPYGASTGRAVVRSVVPGSPSAGILKPGDVLVAASGAAVLQGRGMNGPPVIDQLDQHKPGDLVHLLIQRDGTYMHVTVRLSTMANPRAINATSNLTSGSAPMIML